MREREREREREGERESERESEIKKENERERGAKRDIFTPFLEGAVSEIQKGLKRIKKH